MAIGSVIHVIVLPFVDLVILSTGTGISIFLNTLLAVFYLGERFKPKYDVPAFILIIGGCIAIVLLSDFSDTEYTPEDIERLIISTPSLIFFILYLVVGVCAVL